MKKEMEDKDNLQPYGLSQKDLLKAITFVDKNVESKSFAQGLKENFEGLQAWASSSKLSQKAKKALLTCTVASMLLSSCKQVIPTIDIQTEPIPIVETAVFTETAEPTPVPTLFPKLKVTETSPNAGGSYSEEQLTVIDSEGFKEKVSVINNWWSYWGNAAENQRPFHPKSENVHIVPFFEEENPESYSLAIEAKMDDGNWHTFLLPIDISKSEFRQYPPVEFGPNGIPLKTGYDIPEGFGPLEVTGDIKWTESFGWVRFDESGKMVEVINMETGQWEEKKPLLEAPDVIASNLGLKEDRDYLVQGDYLIDVQSGIPMAVTEGTEWELTSDEERFGKLADMRGGFPMVFYQDVGDMFHGGNEKYKLLSINAVFTGYIDVVDWNFPETGQNIQDYRGLVVYRDQDGSIKKFWVSMFSPDLQGKIGFRWVWDMGSSLEGVTFQEALQRYKPGQVWNISFVYIKPKGGFQENVCYGNGLCTDDYNRTLYLLEEQGSKLITFAESLLDENQAQSVVPEGMVIAPNTLRVHIDFDPFGEGD
ncbi:hypothetical protein KJ570_00795 [Patescibacteria group bacterium]|nr:hypothetical protein [Patescibacteria group bacterium]